MGLTGLGIVILTILLLLLTYHLMQRPQQGEAFADTDTFAIPPSWQWTEKAQQHERGQAELFPFDPNTVDSLSLLRLGLSPKQTRGLLHYRAAGGKFRRKADLRKLYSMTDSDYKRLQAYVTISHPVPLRDAIKNDVPRHQPAPENEVVRKPLVVELNEADSVTLLRISGIGPYRAHRILRYRQLLGGYVSTKQLLEIAHFPDSLLKHFRADSGNISPMNINTMDFKALLRHPYLNYEQVKVIKNWQQKYGKLESLQQLSNSDAFSPEDMDRLKPYVAFLP